jgi:5-deoxy-glucuronate isomerase
VSSLLVHAESPPAPDGTLVHVTPESASWSYVGFHALALGPGQVFSGATGELELCVVIVSGRCHVCSEHGDWCDLGGRSDPFSGPPEAAYLPPGTSYALEAAGADAEIGLCFAPAGSGADARVLPASGMEVELRGHGEHERTVTAILMGEREADSLLVCEVVTPPGHWSSYPPHKHDRDALPEESFLEETYYHRISPAQGFGLQRVYTGDLSLDETMAVRDRDVVLVPRGYHTVSAPPGYGVYYLNVMAGPVRSWAISNDPDHEWTLQP